MRKLILLTVGALLGPTLARAADNPAAPPRATTPPPAASTNPAPAYAPPRVWVFMGLPGDKEHEPQYAALVERLVKVLTGQFQVEPYVPVLFGAGSVKRYPACTAERLGQELTRICQTARETRPVWVFFLGHSNSTASGVSFNIAGADLDARALGRQLAAAQPRASMVLFLTTAAGGKYVKDMARPGRLLVAATDPKAADNETEFPQALLDALEDPEADGDHDGTLSLHELFQAIKDKTAAVYRRNGWAQTEWAMLDGDGDGVATARPAEADADPAKLAGLKYRQPPGPRQP